MNRKINISLAEPDPGFGVFYPLDPGSGSVINFSGSGVRIWNELQYLFDIRLLTETIRGMKKGSFYGSTGTFHPSGIRKKICSDPDPGSGIKKMLGSGPGIKHPGFATLINIVLRYRYIKIKIS
jgi:hypothetical protein